MRRQAAMPVRQPPETLAPVWRYVQWLDGAFTEHQAAQPGLVQGPVFQNLDPAEKILTHWLCYTMDAQTDYRRLWTFSGPVFAEIVETYSTSLTSPLDVLAEYADRRLEQEGKLPRLAAKRQSVKDEKELAVSPRYSWMLVSLALTLVTLNEDYNRNIIAFLGKHKTFIGEETGQLTNRIAFLLDRLTYSDVAAIKDIQLTGKSFRECINRHSLLARSVLDSKSKLETEFQRWMKSGRRFHKRLWAAVRDYLKEGGEFYRYFLAGLKENDLSRLAEQIRREQDVIKVGLEVPGDVWNLRFFRRMFGSNIAPAQLRA